MSISSYSTVVMSWPSTTKVDKSVFPYVTESNGVCSTSWESNWGYCNDIFAGVAGAFGMPLDKVPGLELEVTYETTDTDESFFGCILTIKDGECHYKESKIVYDEKPMDKCLISLDYGLPSYWAREALDHLRFRSDGTTVTAPLSYSSRPRDYSYDVGTPCDEVIDDIEDYFGVKINRETWEVM